MKKIIAVILALSALTVSALAAGSGEPASGEASAAVQEEETSVVRLSEEDAVAAALKDAGLAEEDVTVTRAHLREKEDENGVTVAVYSVKFHTEDTTYKYHVDADTGAILDSTVTEGVSEGRGRGGHSRTGGETDEDADDETSASGEPASEEAASEEAPASEEAASGRASGESGRSGRSRGRSASGEIDGATSATAVTNA